MHSRFAARPTLRAWLRRERGARTGFALVLGFACACACATPRGTIGAVLAQRADRTLVVRSAPAGLAAERAGVAEGDEVLLIDGRDPRAMSAEQVHAALSGEVGAPVKLTLVRDDRILRVTLARTAALTNLTTKPASE